MMIAVARQWMRRGCVRDCESDSLNTRHASGWPAVEVDQPRPLLLSTPQHVRTPACTRDMQRPTSLCAGFSASVHT